MGTLYEIHRARDYIIVRDVLSNRLHVGRR